ncbi:MAG: trans-2-enoyl-CoA reductase family protein [Treponema sp.]|jgi:enoyl-[acyl-carrier protein] reductase/trans-2-enoyl-CoA reductase (NAD+)|nr:trans-2-enoyl-CoA reductase family protein [Treponema sp.]
MIIKPMVRNNICLNSHPAGCALLVQRQIEYAKKNLASADAAASGAPANKPRLALIVGCSNGYGLASRIGAAFGYGAVTVGVSREKPSSKNHTATPGFYNNLAFEREAAKAGLIAKTIKGNAFSDEIKPEVAAAIREAAAAAHIPAKIDLVVYSLASPVRTDPKTGIMYKSVIKPVGESFSGKTLNMMQGTFSMAQAEPATEEEIFNTVKVMGGEDWEMWIEVLEKEGLLSPQTRIIAYSYLGPEHSWPIYKNGTIGKAKEDLERACNDINNKYKGKIAGAWVSVNKALVTRSSAVIPIIPLYISCLFKVMKEKGLHEGCIEQIVRLYRDRLYAAESADTAKVPVDSEGRIRLDDWEMRDDVQKAVMEKMKTITEDNVLAETDVAGFRHDFLEAHGFDIDGVDYNADVDLDAAEKQ